MPLDAKVLGQLLLMQNMLSTLPEAQGICDFACAGLNEVPGVGKVTFHPDKQETASAIDVCIPVATARHRHGELRFELADPEVFAAYKDYVQSFGFLVGVILDERMDRAQGQSALAHERQFSDDAINNPVGLSNDITEHRRLEQQVSDIAELNRIILSASAVGVAAYRAGSGECVMANMALAQMLGGSLAEIGQQNFRQLDSWQHGGLLHVAESVLRDDKQMRYPLRTISSFGKALCLEVLLMSFIYQGEQHLLLLAEDATERIQAQQAQLRAILAASPDAMLLVSLKGDAAAIELANGIAETLFGCTIDELKQRNIKDLFPGMQLPDGLRQDANAAGHKEMLARTADGREIPVETILSHLEMNGEPVVVIAIADISERKLAENRLKASEQRFRSLTQLGADWYWEQDDQFRFTAISGGDNYYDSFHDLSILGKTRWELPHEEDAELAEEWDKHRACLERHEPFRYFEIRRRDTSGQLRILVTSGEPIFAEDGSFVGYRGVASDVTARRKAEIDLRESEFRWKFALEGAGDGLWDWNLETGKIHFSPRWKEMLGYGDNDIGDSLEDWKRYVNPDDMSKAMVALESYLDNIRPPPFHAEYRMRCRDGAWKTVLSRGMVVNRAPDGRPLRMIGTHTDITERTAVEKRLQTLSSAVENSPASVVITNVQGDIEYVNPRFVANTGYSREEVLGLNPRILKSGHQQPQLYKELWQTILSGHEWHGELFNRRKNGEIYLEDVSISPIMDENGEIAHFVAVKQDITQQRNAEIDLLKARDAAESANRAKGEFLANMSHEIRTPLNAIVGLSHLCLNSDLSPKQAGYLKKISFAAKALHGIVSDILDFSKIEAGKFELEVAPFEIAEVLGNLASIFADKAERKGLWLQLETAANIPPHLIGDPLRLSQVMMNLVSNAIKFTHRGGVRIVSEQVAENDEQVRLRFSVQDTGIGIADEQIEKLFQSFSQADSSITRRYGGTGLGLAISKHLITLMKGEITVTSTPGQGSEFSFTVPFQKAQRDIDASFVHLQATELRVLVVDDDAMSCELLCSDLQPLTENISTCGSGEEAVAAIINANRTGQPFNLAIIDWNLPGIDGIEVARQIHALPDLKLLPKLVLISSQGEPEMRRLTKGQKIDALLAKPFKSSGLFNAITDAMGHGMVTGWAAHHPIRYPAELVRKLSGARILLVEDNEINQQVARELLEQAGIFVVTADHGEQALALLSVEDFDGVLMDMQMPVMDGIAATREIRTEPRFSTLPVIAMTANVRNSDREKCLVAGMNDHIAKPVDPLQLITVLSRWIVPAHPVPFDPLRFSDEAARADFRLPHLPGIRLEESVRRMGGDVSIYLAIVEHFRNNRDDLEQIRAALDAGELDRAELLSHTLKGLSATLGADGLNRIMEVLHQTIRDGDLTRLGPMLTQAQAELDQFFVMIERVTRQVGGAEGRRNAPGESADAEKLQPLAETALEQLRQYDSAVEDSLAHIRSLLAGESAEDQALAAIERQVLNYEYDAALPALTQWVAKLGTRG